MVMESEQAPSDTGEGIDATSPNDGPSVLGMLRDEKGHWLPGSKPANLITTESAKVMLERRSEVYAERKMAREAAAGRGVIAAASQLVDRPIASDEDAHEVLAELMVLGGGTAADRGRMREAVAGVSYGLRMAGQAPADDKQAQAVAAVQIVFSQDGAVVASRQILAARED